MVQGPRVYCCGLRVYRAWGAAPLGFGAWRPRQVCTCSAVRDSNHGHVLRILRQIVAEESLIREGLGDVWGVGIWGFHKL